MYWWAYPDLASAGQQKGWVLDMGFDHDELACPSHDRYVDTLLALGKIKSYVVA